MHRSDAELVAACRRGEATAWEVLVQRYQRLIYSIPRRSGLDEDLAADVFQQVFATLVEHLDGLDQPERLKAWLVTTARRETWRVSQRRLLVQSAVRRDDDQPAGEEADPASLPDEAVLELEEQHVVRVAVGSLDDRCRRLLTTLYYQAEPPAYAAIAASLGISTGSIGPTRARCLQKLRRILEERGY